MTLRLVLRPQAEAELLEARDWYEARSPGLGAVFCAAVDVEMVAIAERPLAYPRVHGEMRRTILRRFPYAVFYHVLQDEIVVLGVVHGRRHPRLWQSRV